MADAKHESVEMNAALEAIRARADECVMCGLCLPHCPTFRLTGLETHSPRGRIALAKTLTTGVSADPAVAQALESCLQCRACEAACPAQVRYGEIIEGARALLRAERGSRLVEQAARHPRVAASMLSLLGRVARSLPALTYRLGRRSRWLLRANKPIPPQHSEDSVTALFTGCVSRAFDSDAQRALLEIGTAIGCRLAVLDGAGCCGAIARHLGDDKRAEHMAMRNRDVWGRARIREAVALDSGCIDALRRGSAELHVVEACRWLLARRELWASRLRVKPARIGWFAPCSHRHVLRDADSARELLASLPQVEVVPISTGMGCCGAAGPHLLDHPRQADALAAPIVDQIISLGPDMLVTTNIGCSLHLEERLRLRGVNLPIRHPVACLAERLLPAPTP